MGNTDLEGKLDTIDTKLDRFITQYELDMRGDMDSSDGKRGIIGEIRLMKQYQKENPSIIWLLKNYPLKTIGTILALFLLLMTLYQFGMMEFLLGYFGVPIP